VGRGTGPPFELGLPDKVCYLPGPVGVAIQRRPLSVLADSGVGYLFGCLTGG
jgi:hypothetical protein